MRNPYYGGQPLGANPYMQRAAQFAGQRQHPQMFGPPATGAPPAMNGGYGRGPDQPMSAPMDQPMSYGEQPNMIGPPAYAPPQQDAFSGGMGGQMPPMGQPDGMGMGQPAFAQPPVFSPPPDGRGSFDQYMPGAGAMPPMRPDVQQPGVMGGYPGSDTPQEGWMGGQMDPRQRGFQPLGYIGRGGR